MIAHGRRPVEIIGGGLAGLSLGIFLLRRGVPVCVQEAGFYPRHRVCGEFLSPRDPFFLEKCGLGKLMAGCADGRGSSVVWEWPGRAGSKFQLKHPAWRVSRYRLDFCLAEQLQKAGGRLEVGRRVELEQWEGRDGVVLATGRRRCAEGGWVGLKLHARGLETRADLEMLCGRGAYVGLCRVGEDIVNISGLFRTRTAVGGKWRGLIFLLQKHGLERLAERVARAQPVEGSFCAVSHLDFRLPRSGGATVCRLGDAFGMIAPLSGNGMSVALESAWLAQDALAAYSENRLSWREACLAVSTKLRRAFVRRMFFAVACQQMVLSGSLRPALAAAAASGLLPWRGLHAALGR